MHVAIGNGLLTTDHAASSYGQPVFVSNGIAHGQADMLDPGAGALDFLRPLASEHVESAYFLAINHNRDAFTLGEYNLIAKFCGLHQAHE